MCLRLDLIWVSLVGLGEVFLVQCLFSFNLSFFFFPQRVDISNRISTDGDTDFFSLTSPSFLSIMRLIEGCVVHGLISSTHVFSETMWRHFKYIKVQTGTKVIRRQHEHKRLEKIRP